MDIQKEREVFEELPDVKGILHGSDFGFNESLNQYYHPDHTNHRLNYAFIMGAWMAWQAKAQTVPEAITIGNELQSWVAINSFPADDGEGVLPVIDANSIAAKIEKLTGASQ